MFDVLERIRQLRETRGWSVYRLATLSGIPQSTIATWYQKNLYPPIDKLEMLCDVFDISLSEFFFVSGFNGVTEENSELLEKWTLLGRAEKNAVITVIDAFINLHDNTKRI